MMLEAAELGLETLWVRGYIKPNIIREEFNLPDYLEPVAIFAIGYAADKSA